MSLRLRAARVLGEIGPAALEAADALRELRRRADPEGLVTTALKRIGASKKA
jgi:hypothetical protein